MRTRTKQRKDRYQVKKVHLWIAMGIMLCGVLMIDLEQDIYSRWEQYQRRDITTYEQIDSKLWNKKKCYLCGKNKKSLMGYYRKFDTIGVIVLSDWYVVDLDLHESDGQKIMSDNDPQVSFRMTNVGGVSIIGSSTPDREMATMDISLSQDHRPDIGMLQEDLCQDCLDDVIDTLEVSKDKYGTEQAYPLCLVDFQTLEVYPLQEWHVGYSIRDYWVEIEYDEDKVKIKAFYLPIKSGK